MLALACVATFGGLFGGPALGDHEALVAQCARNMRLSGDWVVSRFLDTPFIRKPPLPYWLVAGTSYLFPADSFTGLPVTAAVARFYSAAAGLGTVLLLWLLALSMYSRRVGIVAALAAAGSVFILLYAVNATAEMLLTFCCTWAFAHFWFAATCRTPGRRALHMLLFYIALGAGMLAKGPAPLSMVAVPLACWWFTWRPQRVLARRGPGALRRACLALLRQSMRQTVRAFSHLWLVPGILVFLAVFVPWMLAVAKRDPAAWDIWNWQYFQRFQGDYEDNRPRGLLYYVPMVLGLAAPWTLALPEALLAPWLARYRPWRKGLYFAGIWAVIGTLVMSIMEFKKPYYILPAMPGFILLVAPVLDSLLQRAVCVGRTARILAGVVGAIAVLGVLVVGRGFAQKIAPIIADRLTMLLVLLLLAIVSAAVLYLRRRRYAALVTVAWTTVVIFDLSWYAAGPALDSMARPAELNRVLRGALVPYDAPIYWVDQRPDARLSFYFNQRSEHMIDPAEIVARSVERKSIEAELKDMAIERANALLALDHPVYLVLDRRHVPLISRPADEFRAIALPIGEVNLDGIPDGEDWIVLTNAPHNRASRPLDSSPPSRPVSH